MADSSLTDFLVVENVRVNRQLPGVAADFWLWDETWHGVVAFMEEVRTAVTAVTAETAGDGGHVGNGGNESSVGRTTRGVGGRQLATVPAATDRDPGPLRTPDCRA